MAFAQSFENETGKIADTLLLFNGWKPISHLAQVGVYGIEPPRPKDT